MKTDSGEGEQGEALLPQPKKDLVGKEAASESVNSPTQNTVGSRYVVGFMFSPSFEQVVLIRKSKPAWQAGLLNGVGGKIEQGESAYDAMRREFSEEAGLDRHWFHFASLGGTNNDGGAFQLECFWSREHITSVQCQEVEQLEITDVASIAGRTDTIGNLAWLITLARDFGKGVFPPRAVKAEYGPSVVDGNVAVENTGASSQDSPPSSTVAGAQEKEDRLKRALKAIWDFSANATPSVDLLNSISETCCRALSDTNKTLEKTEADVVVRLTEKEAAALSHIINNGWGDGDFKGYGQENVQTQLRAMQKFEEARNSFLKKTEASADNVEAERQKECEDVLPEAMTDNIIHSARMRIPGA